MKTTTSLVVCSIFSTCLIGCATPPPRDVPPPTVSKEEVANAKRKWTEEQVARNGSFETFDDLAYLELAKKDLVSRMKDPESTKFREISVNYFNGARHACGQYDAKNSYGGYSGYRDFAWINGILFSHFLMPSETGESFDLETSLNALANYRNAMEGCLKGQVAR